MKCAKTAEKRSSYDQNRSQQQEPVSLRQMRKNGQNLPHDHCLLQLASQSRYTLNY